MAIKNYYGNTIETNQPSANSDVSFDMINSTIGILDRKEVNGMVMASGIWGNINNNYKHIIIEVNGGETVSCNSGNNIRIIALTELSDVIANTSAHVIEGGIRTTTSFTLPSEARYLVVETVRGGVRETFENGYYINGIDYSKTIRKYARDLAYDDDVKWCCFGDSISERYYSFFNEDGTVTTRESGWDIVYPKWISKLNRWDNYTNRATGGMGWIMSSTSSLSNVAYNRVKQVDFTQFNLVTFAYGINDWKAGSKPLGSIEDSFTYSEDMTPTTVVESMRYCFNYIMSKNPYIKIYVITPFNCMGYSYNFGDDSTNWARGYSGFTHGKTLDEFADLMKQVCDEYDVEVIDMTTSSCINKANIRQLLPDGVHPSQECHELLAREIASKIQFK